MEAAHILLCGGIGVIPTDTIYGIAGSAFSPDTVKRIYHIRKRAKTKPMIVLIASLSDLKRFGVRISAARRKILSKLWPGPASVILPVRSKKFRYLHRGKKSVAFRMPAKQALRGLLKKTGPLVAPSANPEGLPPAKNIRAARKYFGIRVDFYLDGGTLKGKPSTLISLKPSGKVNVIRQGALSLISLIRPN